MRSLSGPSATVVVAPEGKCATKQKNTTSERTEGGGKKKKERGTAFPAPGSGKEEGAGVALQPWGAHHPKPFLIYTINRRELK